MAPAFVRDGDGVIRPRNQWRLAVRDFLEGRSEVNETAVLYSAIGWPPYIPLDAKAMAWAHSSLEALGFRRQHKGRPIWRKV